MKGVILTAGKGTRLLPLTQEISKCILPIGGMSIVHRSLDIISKFDFIDEICILTNIDNLKQIKEEFNSEYKGKKIIYLVQDIERYGMGTASAILSAKDFINNEKVLVMAGDIIVDEMDVERMVMKYKDDAVSSMLLKTVENPKNFGIVTLNEESKVIDIQEKPDEPKSNLINGSVYLFDEGDMKYLEGIKLSRRNEYEVTDALTKMSVDEKLYGYVAEGYWDDVGNPVSVLKSNAELMRKIKGTDNSRFKSEFKGEVNVGENAYIENCFIEGPCVISKNAVLRNVKIKPYTFIGEKCIINGGEIYNSIILNETKINDSYLKDCLIANKNVLEKNEIKNEKGKFGCVTSPNYVFEPGFIVESESKLM